MQFFSCRLAEEFLANAVTQPFLKARVVSGLLRRDMGYTGEDLFCASSTPVFKLSDVLSRYLASVAIRQYCFFDSFFLRAAVC